VQNTVVSEREDGFRSLFFRHQITFVDFLK